MTAQAAGSTTNPIVLENQKPGTPVSVWGLHGSLDGVGDTNIEGFATQISVDQGQTVNFKINTPATSYRVDIYRLGYYGGDGATLVNSYNVNLPTAQVQPTPLMDDATNEIDAGNWSVSTSWQVPSTATSGVYFAKLTRTDGTAGQNMIPFIVRADGVASDITFQTNDSTWQAYNPWGGYNLYQGPDGKAADRANAVSYNRPIVTNSTAGEAGPQDFVFGEELPAIEWLEQNGYSVSYISSNDAANNPSSLLNSKTYMEVGHDEYWSASQYANVQAAANAGVNLMFLSGNQTYWDVKYAPSLDPSATPNRTIIEYKDPWAGAQIDPAGTSGGGSSSFRDPVNGPGLPENGLAGTIFQVDDSGKLSNIVLTAADAGMGIWQNTAVTSLAPGQTLALTNLLGYEWDTDNNNGFRPAGLVDLSSTTQSVGTVIVNEAGSLTAEGTATHSITVYRNSVSGALVFSAGTVMWSWGLSTQHALFDGQTAPTTSVVQQAMVNELAQMGVQPATLQASLVFATQSTDRTPPVSTISSIAGGGTLVSDQIATISGTAVDGGSGTVAVVEVSTDGGTTWNRANGTTNWTYSWIAPQAGTYTVETRATDSQANLEKPTDAVKVQVASSNVTSLFSQSPGDVIKYSDVSDNQNSGDESSVELGVNFTPGTSGRILGVRFYKGVGDTGAHTGSLWTSTGTLLATGASVSETSSGWQTVTFSQPITVTAGQTYVASFHSSGDYAVDTNYFTGPTTAGNLTTGLNAGVYTYGSSTVFPSKNTNNGSNYWVDVDFVSANATPLPPVANKDSGLIATENTPASIAASTLLANDTDPNGFSLNITGVSAPSNGTVAFNSSTNTVTFTPTGGYTGPAGFTYAIADSAGLTSSTTVALSVNLPGKPETLFPTSTTPTVAADSDGSAVELGVKFSAAVAGTITGVSFYKSATDTGTHTGTLWTSSGTVLATGTFTGETTSGWQTLTFSNPVSIAAGTTYVAGFHSNGHYASTGNFFTTPYTNGDLAAPANAGVYAYGASGAFPTSSYAATNYDVSVQFTTAGAAPQTQLAAVSPLQQTKGVNSEAPLHSSAAMAIATEPAATTSNFLVPTSAASVDLGAVGNFVDIAAPTSQTFIFDDQATQTMKIDHASDFAGRIQGFGSDSIIDLADVISGTVTSAYTQGQGGGALSVSDGTHAATVDFTGFYAQQDFVFSPDGAGGTVVKLHA